MPRPQAKHGSFTDSTVNMGVTYLGVENAIGVAFASGACPWVNSRRLSISAKQQEKNKFQSGVVPGYTRVAACGPKGERCRHEPPAPPRRRDCASITANTWPGALTWECRRDPPQAYCTGCGHCHRILFSLPKTAEQFGVTRVPVEKAQCF